MFLVVLLTLATAPPAPTSDDARALLQDIVSTTHAARSWRAEGTDVGEVDSSGVQQLSKTHFKLTVAGPTKMRWETTGDERTLVVCDGTDHWTYHPPGDFFFLDSVSVSPCLPPHDVSALTDHLVAAAVTGHDRVEFAGGSRECEIIRAEYARAVPGGGGESRNLVHTLCVDPVQHLLLRDRFEFSAGGSDMHIVSTVTYSNFERDIRPSPEAFEFRVPTGAIQADGPLITDGPVAKDGVYRIGAGVSGPTIASKLEPTYTDEARQARVSGIALVSLTVDSDGKPQNMRVVRGLGFGLDEKAVEAIGEWRFHPGTNGGAPVAVGPLTVAVNFSLP